MSKFSEMAAPLAGKFGLTVKDAEQFLLQMTEVLNDGLRADKQVKIKGMGTFKVTPVSARKSVNVNTGEPIVISSRDKITFTPDASLRDRVNSPFAQFETVVVNDGVDLGESFVASIPNEEIKNENNLNEEGNMQEEKMQIGGRLSHATDEEGVVSEFHAVSRKKKESEASSLRGIRGSGRIWYGTIALLLLLIVFGAFYFLRDATTAKSGEKKEKRVEATERREVKGTERDNSLANGETVNPSSSDYSSYPIMQYGAYEFDGVAAEVTVKKGQTLASISRQYFGPSPGADQYIEAFNGKKEFKEGDVIKIPKLVLKKKNK